MWKGDGRTLWNYIKKHDVRILSAYSQSDPNCLWQDKVVK